MVQHGVAVASKACDSQGCFGTGDTFDRVREMESLHFWKGRCALRTFCLVTGLITAADQMRTCAAGQL